MSEQTENSFTTTKAKITQRLKDKQEGRVRISKKGSVIFYVFLFAILVFFVVMYIKYQRYKQGL